MKMIIVMRNAQGWAKIKKELNMSQCNRTSQLSNFLLFYSPPSYERLATLPQKDYQRLKKLEEYLRADCRYTGEIAPSLTKYPFELLLQLSERSSLIREACESEICRGRWIERLSNELNDDQPNADSKLLFHQLIGRFLQQFYQFHYMPI